MIIIGFNKLFNKDITKDIKYWKIGKGIEIPESVGYFLIGGIFLYLPLISAYIITVRLNINPIIIQDKYNALEKKIKNLNQDIDRIEFEFKMLQNEIRYSFTPYLDTTFVNVKKNDNVFHASHKNCKIILNEIKKTRNKVNLIFITPKYRDDSIWLHVKGKNYIRLENNFRYILSLDSISENAKFASISFVIEKKFINKEGG